MEHAFYSGKRPDGLWVFGRHLLPDDLLEQVEWFESLEEAGRHCRGKRDAAPVATHDDDETMELFGDGQE
jgi:hypothetical protein